MSKQREIWPGDQGAVLTEPISPMPPGKLFMRAAKSEGREFSSRLAGLPERSDFPSRAEFARLRPPLRFLMIGLSVWIGLIVLATVLAVAAVEMSTISAPGWLSARASASTRNEIRPSAGFEAILQRPLFSRGRQPAAAAVSEAPPSPVAMTTLDPGITLKGVYINGAMAKAFLISAQDPLGIWVEVNEEIVGWRVVAIKPEQVLLNSQNEKLEVWLGVGSNAK
jgi:hypothetical protein